ncbi:MAG TPA: hemerythrin domain-containing protein [Acidimicrobiales bacterium]|nr:hemerythrin domain-containing protein [Acidimicrobiales bacterium]
MANIFRMLEADHREVIALLDQMCGDAAGRLDADGRRLLLDRLVAAESRHEAAEELTFWPAVRRRVGDGAGRAEQGRRQEVDARYVLDALRYEQDGPQLVEHIEAAAELIRRHIAFEEQQVWPELRRVLGPLGSRLLGLKFKAALAAAPTRPHPHGPDRPLGLATVGAAAAMGDRIRDRLSGRARRLAPPPSAGAGSTAGPAGADGVEFLAGDHRRVETVLRRVQSILDAGGDPDTELVAELVRELSVHDAIEREHLYPLVRQRLEQGNDVYTAALEEHGHIAVVAAELDRRPEHDQLRRDDLARLVQLVRTHVAEEETAIFPALRAHLTPQELAQLAGDLRAARDTAPTRPHPHTAGTGLGARVSRLLAGPLDRTRDSLSGRR